MTPAAVKTHAEVRAWLRSLGLTYIPRLPKTPDRVIYVDDPIARQLWRIRLHESGGYMVEPYVPEVQS